MWSEASLGDKNGVAALKPLDVHDKRYGKLSTLFLLVWYKKNIISGIVSLFIKSSMPLLVD